MAAAPAVELSKNFCVFATFFMTCSLVGTLAPGWEETDYYAGFIALPFLLTFGITAGFGGQPAAVVLYLGLVQLAFMNVWFLYRAFVASADTRKYERFWLLIIEAAGATHACSRVAALRKGIAIEGGLREPDFLVGQPESKDQ
eukprot:TRINITY_DN15579_c0_g1_i1.p2 TRINITY_DN15579_c0_g1~~TRINITY_DN15579_c0_g1_i1.p2  ORF type:complete len:143 (-),score=26.23 TRINITY_DN15579_c0_g1_i1:133-561(-)